MGEHHDLRACGGTQVWTACCQTKCTLSFVYSIERHRAELGSVDGMSVAQAATNSFNVRWRPPRASYVPSRVFVHPASQGISTGSSRQPLVHLQWGLAIVRCPNVRNQLPKRIKGAEDNRGPQPAPSTMSKFNPLKDVTYSGVTRWLKTLRKFVEAEPDDGLLNKYGSVLDG